MSRSTKSQSLRLLTMVVVLIVISSFSATSYGGPAEKKAEKAKSHSIDTPEGMAIHRQMMQMQANQSAFQMQQSDKAPGPKTKTVAEPKAIQPTKRKQSPKN